MRWSGQHIYDLVSKFRNTVDFSKDVTFYQPVNNANPNISIGSSDDERLRILVNYQGTTTQSLQQVLFTTYTQSGTANDGEFIFQVDEVSILDIDDGGLDLRANMGISIAGTDIITDSSGTATLSNIDALDATTIATLETAMEANLDTFGSQMTSASSLATIGTITTGVWNGTVISSEYLDSDTAHLSGAQTFTGVKTFPSAIFDGDKSVTPGDGAVIHVDTHNITDTNTSASGTAALYTHVNIESPRLFATNSSVTTTAAATLYIKSAPSASTNQTITNPYALWVDAGLVKFDGALRVDGNITSLSDIAGENLTLTSATTENPVIQLKNTTDDDVSSELIFEKLRDDDAVAQGQNLGAIWFRGQDGGQNTEDYAYIIGEIDVSTDGQESGQLVLGVANHDGGNGAGLTLTGGSANDEIDVTVGLGASSVVTIPGDIDLAGDIDVDGTLETDALTIGGAAVLAQATESAVGAVELATTAEADTGTDTARAVTPQGLKSHVDAYARKSVLRCNTFYVNDNPFVQNNLYFGNAFGNQPWAWNDPAPVGGVIGDTSSFTIDGDDEKWGILLPFNISKIDVQCSLRPQLGTGDDFTIAIYTGIRSDDSSADLTLTKVAHNSVALSSSTNRYTRNDVSVTANYDAGTMIYVGVGSEDSTNMKNGQGYMNITVTER